MKRFFRITFFSLLFLTGSKCASAGEMASKGGFSLFRSSDLNQAQEKARINASVLKNSNKEPLSIVISLSKQRAFLFVGSKVAMESPISSGRKPGWTPEGKFTILEKDPTHRSSLYGNFVDEAGNVIRGGIDRRRDAAPSGTHYEGAPMLYFMRLTEKGVGMHVGYLPGYPASHGCIRMPQEMAKAFYEAVSLGTPVTVEF
jgi:lipoprotein-anchoring transpeptidase ErfK/SrfK